MWACAWGCKEKKVLGVSGWERDSSCGDTLHTLHSNWEQHMLSVLTMSSAGGMSYSGVGL